VHVSSYLLWREPMRLDTRILTRIRIRTAWILSTGRGGPQSDWPCGELSYQSVAPRRNFHSVAANAAFFHKHPSTLKVRSQPYPARIFLSNAIYQLAPSKVFLDVSRSVNISVNPNKRNFGRDKVQLAVEAVRIAV
jgi:hypothetical protein